MKAMCYSVTCSYILSGLTFGMVASWDYCYPDFGEFYRTNSKLTNVPTDIPSEAQIVYLNFNKITTIRMNSFLHLSMCAEMYLSVNSISNISSGAFSGLHKLELLDLSHNSMQLRGQSRHEERAHFFRNIDTLQQQNTQDVTKSVPWFGQVASAQFRRQQIN